MATPETTPDGQTVEMHTAVLRGLAMRCPSCGKGRLFGRFLKVRDRCAACGEVMSHQRADDFPAHLTILVVGHILVPVLLYFDLTWHPAPWLEYSVAVTAAVGLAAGLLQPIKGAIVAMQWQMGLHGFGDAREQRLAVTRQS